MIEWIEKIGNWTIAHGAENKVLLGIGAIVLVSLSISFYKKVIKGKQSV